jgi:hypothetical protein
LVSPRQGAIGVQTLGSVDLILFGKYLDIYLSNML